MRIKSAFKDYYDSALAFGVDTSSLTYIRITNVKTISKDMLNSGPLRILYSVYPEIPLYTTPGNSRTRPHRILCYTDTIFFCGKMYIRFRNYNQDYEYTNMTSRGIPTLNTFSIDEAREFFKQTINPGHDQFSVQEALLKRDTDNAHRLLGTPIFVVPSTHPRYRNVGHVLLNPKLSDYNFGRVLHPYDAYQQIDMYLGNQMAEQKDPPIEISDEVMLSSKGFDKYSFRKDPVNKK